MSDYGHLLDGSISDYVLVHVCDELSPPDGCTIEQVSTGSALIIEDDDLARNLIAWMIREGVPIVDKDWIPP